MRRKERRKTNRYPAGWIANYSPTGLPGVWSRCDIVDVSAGGAGLILAGPPVEKDTQLTLELQAADGSSIGGQVQGTVRHVSMSPDGTVHIGVEFAPDQNALVVMKITSELATVLTAV